jgi:hypothetical protein
MTQLMLFLCFGAVAKSAEKYFFEHLPMDPLTRAVFIGLHFLLLLAFCRDVFELLSEDNQSFPPRNARSRGRPPLKERSTLLPQIDLQKVFDRFRSLLRRRKGKNNELP